MQTASIEDLVAETFGVQHTPNDPYIDFINQQRDEIYALKFNSVRTRDIRETIMRLAFYMQNHEGIRAAYGLFIIPSASGGKVLGEWNSGKSILRSELFAKLKLIALVGDESPLCEPPTREMEALASRFLQIKVRLRHSPEPHRWRHLEVEKVLLHYWLQGLGFISMGELQKVVGCTYPTAKRALDSLFQEELIERIPGGAVKLKHYPRDRWIRLAQTSRQICRPVEFVDPTGEPQTGAEIQKRLRRHPVPNVAIGGTEAARYWNPAFDLNGTPRLDLVVHTVAGAAPDYRFIRQLDPALMPRSGQHKFRSPVLVLHPIYRIDPLFIKGKEPMPWASPVETLLDLNEMGLTQQANNLVAKLKSQQLRTENSHGGT